MKKSLTATGTLQCAYGEGSELVARPKPFAAFSPLVTLRGPLRFSSSPKPVELNPRASKAFSRSWTLWALNASVARSRAAIFLAAYSSFVYTTPSITLPVQTVMSSA